jgi:preprotein translocase subunit SecF
VSLGTQLSDIFHERTNYDFIGPTKRWFAISGVFILVGIAALGIRGGLTLGIDFKGGTAWEVKTQGIKPTSNGVRDTVIAAGLIEPSIQLLGRPPDTIRVEAKRAPVDEQT